MEKKGGGGVVPRCFDAWLAGVPRVRSAQRVISAEGQRRIKSGAKSKRFFNQCVDALCECLGILDIARF